MRAGAGCTASAIDLAGADGVADKRVRHPFTNCFRKCPHPDGRRRRAGLTALAGYDSGDPFSLDQRIDFIGALRRSVKGLRIAYNPNMNVFPVDPDVAACRSLAAAKRTTPYLARAQCSSDSSRGRCLRALREATCVSE